jgi:hypothetical protein
MFLRNILLTALFPRRHTLHVSTACATPDPGASHILALFSTWDSHAALIFMGVILIFPFTVRTKSCDIFIIYHLMEST